MTIEDVRNKIKLKEWEIKIGNHILWLRDKISDKIVPLNSPMLSHWELDSDSKDVCVCKHCGFTISFEEMQHISTTNEMTFDVYNFCPKCGNNMWLLEEHLRFDLKKERWDYHE